MVNCYLRYWKMNKHQVMMAGIAHIEERGAATIALNMSWKSFVLVPKRDLNEPILATDQLPSQILASWAEHLGGILA